MYFLFLYILKKRMEKSSLKFGFFTLGLALICIISIFFIPKVYLIIPITLGVIFSVFGYLFGIDYKNVK